MQQSTDVIRLFSDSGRCHSFDHRGTSGFGRGEGAGCVLLKPLDDALKAGDNIRAVIVNTGVNQDGRTNGITLPNGDSQKALIRSVYSKAGIDPSQVGYVEAHGTGTKVGDPIEADALHTVFCKDRSSREPLFLGSVKSKIGHLEGASGIISIIKTALMLERGLILPMSNFEKPPDSIPLAEWNIKASLLDHPRFRRFNISDVDQAKTDCQG